MGWDPGILEGYKRRAIYTLTGSFIAMILIGALAMVSKRPYLFPSLGPTAIMLFAHPLARDASPRHVLIGHFIGAASGYMALAMTGLISVPFSSGISDHRILAAALALGLTAGLMTIARSEHAPAGATTLIVALGIMPRVVDFAFLMTAIVVLTLFCLVANRFLKINYPIWNPR